MVDRRDRHREAEIAEGRADASNTDAADADARIRAPLLALWGRLGTVGALYDVLETWREKAVHVEGHALECGHSPQEEVPDALLDALDGFLAPLRGE